MVGDVWVTDRETTDLSALLGLEHEQFIACYTDVAIESADHQSKGMEHVSFRRITSGVGGCSFLTPDGGCSVYSGRPKQCRSYPWWPRLLASPKAWAAEQNACEGINTGGEIVSVEHITGEAAEWAAWLECFPTDAVAQVGETARWAKEFVEPLNLCPWATASLSERGATRYVHTVATTPQELAAVIEIEALNLLRRKEHHFEVAKHAVCEDPSQNGTAFDVTFRRRAAHNLAAVDINTAITFIIIPAFAAESFEDFHDFCVWLDEKFFAEATIPEAFQSTSSVNDEYAEVEEDQESIEETEQIRLGDLVITAGFHPLWEYGGSDPAVDWEKRSPLPTISLVHAEAIDGAEAVTAKIADHNYDVLSNLGTKEIQSIYLQKVMSSPVG